MLFKFPFLSTQTAYAIFSPESLLSFYRIYNHQSHSPPCHHETGGSVHQSVGSGNVLVFDSSYRISNKWLFTECPEIPGIAGQLNPQRSSAGRLCLRRIGTFVIVPIPQPYFERVFPIHSQNKRRQNHEEG